jgi:hypothetical protein
VRDVTGESTSSRRSSYSFHSSSSESGAPGPGTIAVPKAGAKLQIPELLEYETSESLRGGNLKNSLRLDSSDRGLIVAMADPCVSALRPCRIGYGSAGPAVATMEPIESKDVRGIAVGRGWGVAKGREKDCDEGPRTGRRVETTCGIRPTWGRRLGRGGGLIGGGPSGGSVSGHTVVSVSDAGIVSAGAGA